MRFDSIKFKSAKSGVLDNQATVEEIDFLDDSDNLELSAEGYPKISGEFDYDALDDDWVEDVFLVEHAGYQFTVVADDTAGTFKIYKRSSETASFSLVTSISASSTEIYNFFSFNGKLYLFADFDSGADEWCQSSPDGETWTLTNYFADGRHWEMPITVGLLHYSFWNDFDDGTPTRDNYLHIATTDDYENFYEVGYFESDYEVINMVSIDEELYLYQRRSQVIGDNVNVQKYRLVKFLPDQKKLEIIKYFDCGKDSSELSAVVFNGEIVIFQPHKYDTTIWFYNGLTWETKKIDKYSSGSTYYIRLVTDDRLYFEQGSKIHFLTKDKSYIKKAYSLSITDFNFWSMQEWNGFIFFGFHNDTTHITRIYYADEYGILSTSKMTIDYPKINVGQIIPYMLIFRSETSGGEIPYKIYYKRDNDEEEDWVLLRDTTFISDKDFIIDRIKFAKNITCDLLQFRLVVYGDSNGESGLINPELEFLYKKINIENAK
jgi:hypothetical protein